MKFLGLQSGSRRVGGAVQGKYRQADGAKRLRRRSRRPARGDGKRNGNKTCGSDGVGQD